MLQIPHLMSNQQKKIPRIALRNESTEARNHTLKIREAAYFHVKADINLIAFFRNVSHLNFLTFSLIHRVLLIRFHLWVFY